MLKPAVVEISPMEKLKLVLYHGSYLKKKTLVFKLLYIKFLDHSLYLKQLQFEKNV